MKTYEELRGMTQEDLVRLVLELQERLIAMIGKSNFGKRIPFEIREHIRRYFQIDPNTGKITRRDRKGGTGSYDKDGYLILKVKGCQFKAHRIAWFLYYGKDPLMEIDHINRDRSDNRKSNLRQSNRALNVRNTYINPNKDTGIVGVYIDKCTEGLKKVYTTRYKGKTYRFYNLADAVKFREEHGQRIK